MQGKTHMVGGIVSGVIGNSVLLQPTLTEADSMTKVVLGAGFIGASIIGSLYPDVDHKGSFMGKRLIISPFLFQAGATMERTLMRRNKNTWFVHRGILHTPLFLFIVWFLGTLFLPTEVEPIINGFILGMASHLALDFMTISGVPLLFPFTDKKQHMLPVKTGGTFEHIFYFVLWGILGLFIIGSI